jgi:DNA-directed RNA polymerase subunit RPC12/RpoP
MQRVGREEFCQNCGTPNDHLEGDSLTNTCEECGHPIDMSPDEPEHDDPYAF